MTIWSAEIKILETLLTSIKGRFSELEKDYPDSYGLDCMVISPV
jgi:hypothetical protein